MDINRCDGASFDIRVRNLQKPRNNSKRNGRENTKCRRPFQYGNGLTGDKQKLNGCYIVRKKG